MAQLSGNLHELDVAIIGAGLSGLYLAHLLGEQRGNDWLGRKVGLFDARKRCGGRVYGLSLEQEGQTLDLGPSCLWPDDQPAMSRLVAKFQLPLLRQWQQGVAPYQPHRETPPQRYRDQQTYAGACRISGGSVKLVAALKDSLPPAIIHTGYRLQSLQDEGSHISLRFQLGSSDETVLLQAKQVILAIPPRIAEARIQFNPGLPEAVQSLLKNTPTWMAGQAKVAIHYGHSFWREQGFSGGALANYPGAMLGEVFDACGSKGQPAALGAFMALPPAPREQWYDKLPPLILDQLNRLFGPQAATPVQIQIKDWASDRFTATPDDAEPLFEHPDYGHRYLELDYWNDKLFFSGSETSRQAGGYMEGALQSAERVLKALTVSTGVEVRYA